MTPRNPADERAWYDLDTARLRALTDFLARPLNMVVDEDDEPDADVVAADHAARETALRAVAQIAHTNLPKRLP